MSRGLQIARHCLKKSQCRRSLVLLYSPLSSSSPLRHFSSFSFSSSPSSSSFSSLSGTKMDKKEHLAVTSQNFRDPDIIPATVTKLSELSPTVKGLTLNVERKYIRQGFKAGQWLDFFIPGVEQVGGFSMCSAPLSYTQSGELELAVKESSWAPASWVHNTCKQGDKVTFRFGGDFHYPDLNTPNPVNLLLIAGGVGINPLLSIWLHARDLQRKREAGAGARSGQEEEVGGALLAPPTRVDLLYSATSQQELIFKSELDSTVQEMPSCFSSQYFITRCPEGRTGRPGSKQVASVLRDLKPGVPVVAYLCGPPEMIKDMTGYLTSEGVPHENIKFELWY